MSLEEQWLLAVPFTSAPHVPFTEVLTETVTGRAITFQKGSAPYGFLLIEELKSVEEARHQFEALKRGMLAASLAIGCGIRIKHDLLVIDDATKLPSQPDQPYTCHQDRKDSRLAIRVGEPTFQLPRVLPKVMHGLAVGLGSSFAVEALRDEHVALACDLYVDSYFERSVPARFISLMGVLEVLKDQDPVSTKAVLLVDDWLKQLDQLQTEEANSFQGQLCHMKQLSISRGIGRVVRRHLEEKRAREAQKLYGIRSNLVHKGQQPADLGESLELTQLLVRELLVKILQAGSR
jgi:hypothetical protein